MKKARGTWKIAYADFITALMLMFLLLWLIASVAKEDLQGISLYFSGAVSSPTLPISHEGKVNQHYKEVLGFDNLLEVPPSMLNATLGIPKVDMQVLSNVLESIRQSEIQSEFADNVCVYWHNGIIIEVFDTYGRPLFEQATDELKPWAPNLLKEIATKVLKHQPYHITIDGHASVRTRQADCWSLSFRRANTVRHHIEPYLAKGQVIKVIGSGDTDLLLKDKPHDPCNMRISITLVDTKSLHKRQQSLPEGILRNSPCL